MHSATCSKPRVERSFWEVERSFFNGRTFLDFDDMRAQLAQWLDTIVDQRRRHGETPHDRFALEREHLVPLPRHPYDTARVVYRLCSIDGFVAWEGNAYAVPYDHVTDILPVRITQRELFVYAADLTCVARHELAPARQRAQARSRRAPPEARATRAPSTSISSASPSSTWAITPAAFFRLMSAGPPRLWGHHARQILLLRERFATADLDAALAHAARFGAFDHHAIERILAARATPRSLDEYVAEQTVRRVADALGQTRTAPRDLAEYDRLPGGPEPPAPRRRRPQGDPMSRRPSSGNDPAEGADLALERLRRHLVFLGLTHTLADLDEHLAWATRERPGPTALLEHILGAEVGSKLEGRIARRVATSGLREHKTLEAFDWNFQPALDKASSSSSRASTSSAATTIWSSPARAAPERVTSSRPSAAAPASRPSPCATPAASTCSTTSTPASPTAPTPAASRPGPDPTCSSSTTSASARSRSATTSPPPPTPSSTSSIAGTVTFPPP